jgi:branched-chain amino acid transport system permease protein
VKILQVNVATIVLGVVVLGAFFVLFRFTKVGLAMRATAVDQEAALAQGISVGRIFALSWAIAGAVAVVGGMMLAGGAGPAPGLSVSLSLIALRAFPAIILGGLDSPGGAVAGGLTIGVAQVMAGGYIPNAVPSLGNEFADVVPYLIMLVVLLVRPYGLFGTREVTRV